MTEQTDASERPQLRLVQSGVNFSEGRTRKAEQDASVVSSNAFEPEDEYHLFYAGGAKDAGVLAPPYNLASLDKLTQENNALLPCIEAMVTNVDGTGYDFEHKDESAKKEQDAVIDELRDFFSEPWPGMSFTTMRKKLRRDLEKTGNAYVEVLRNPKDEIVFLRYIDAKMLRLVKLDEAVPVEKKIRRRGVELSVTVQQRERRFVQLLNGVTLVYFKEFGASRDLNKTSGTWSPKGTRLPAKDRATEVIHFTKLPDAHTPYGVPVWINQLPSVLGSRKAEEFNLEFFDNGGVPPALIILQGGQLQPQTRNALELKMSRGTAQAKNRIQVLEVMPTGGTFEKEATAKVTVERFGAERQDDAMFDGYDDKCEVRVRRSFRLPPIFVGAAEDYSFASATASYAVAEAQVFKPERDEFDEIITVSLIRAMGHPEYRLASKPLVIEDATLKLQGIQMAITTSSVDKEDVIYEINEATGTDLKYEEPPEPIVPTNPGQPGQAAGAGVPGEEAAPTQETKTPDTETDKPKGKPNGQGYTGAKVSKEAGTALLLMASLRKRDIDGIIAFSKIAKDFTAEEADNFEHALGLASFETESGGLGALTAATIDVIAKNGGCGCGHEHR